jgi:hypothetical protein
MLTSENAVAHRAPHTSWHPYELRMCPERMATT